MENTQHIQDKFAIDELLHRGLARPYLDNQQILCQFPQFLDSALSAIREERGFTARFKKDAPSYEQSLRDAQARCSGR